MQDNNANKIDYNIARAISKNTFALAFKIFLYMFLLLFIFFVFGTMLIFKSTVFSIIVNLAFISLCFYFFYNSGISTGEKHAALSEIYAKKLSLNSLDASANDNEKNRCFHKLKGVFAVLFGVLPYFLTALVFAFITTKQYYNLGSLPPWISEYMHQTDLGVALNYYTETAAVGLEQILRVVVRAFIMPYVAMFNNMGADVQLILERLSPLLLLIIPMGFALGYSQGDKRRRAISKAITQNAKKKKLMEKYAKTNKEKEKNRLI